MTVLGLDLGQNLAACSAEFGNGQARATSLWFSKWQRQDGEDWSSLSAMRHVAEFVRAIERQVAPHLVVYEETWYAKWSPANPNDCYQMAAQGGWVGGWADDLQVAVACVDPRDAHRATGMDKASRVLYMTGLLPGLDNLPVTIIGGKKSKPLAYANQGKERMGHLADASFLAHFGGTRLRVDNIR